jgi:acyl-coenzyme A thioesterase PaaI-like protein
MAESIKTRLMRLFFLVHPAYHGTGGRVTYIASDWSDVRVEIPSNWRTRNYVGTIFGGSMYAAVDPMYMIMLIQRLGPDYIVWDKAASIQFKKPGKSKLIAHFNLSDDEVASIRAELTNQHSLDRHYTVELVDVDGNICAKVNKTIYIRKKNG